MSEFKTIHDVIKNYAYDLSKNVVTDGDVLDTKVINQSIENILLTNFGERVFRLNFGSNLISTLFEASTTYNIQGLFSNVLRQIQANESRVTVQISNSSIFFDDIDNTMYLTIVYSINSTGIVGSLNKKVTI
jgi:phage baseplate assembly protein W